MVAREFGQPFFERTPAGSGDAVRAAAALLEIQGIDAAPPFVEALADRFLEKFQAALAALKPGDPMD